MTHKAQKQFWRKYDGLPETIQEQADKQFRLLKDNHRHPSLHFKPVGSILWSVRVSRDYRALAAKDGDIFAWFWIGPHDEYQRLIRTITG